MAIFQASVMKIRLKECSVLPNRFEPLCFERLHLSVFRWLLHMNTICLEDGTTDKIQQIHACTTLATYSDIGNQASSFYQQAFLQSWLEFTNCLSAYENFILRGECICNNKELSIWISRAKFKETARRSGQKIYWSNKLNVTCYVVTT